MERYTKEQRVIIVKKKYYKIYYKIKYCALIGTPHTNIQPFKTTLYKTQNCDVRFIGPLMDSRIS